MKLKKLLASILVLCMVLSTMGTVVLAGETDVMAVNDDVISSVEAKKITENGLTYAVQFDGNEQISGYANWKMNVELTSNTDLTLEYGNNTADGYLSVFVPGMGWRDIPQGDLFGNKMDAVKIKANEPIQVLNCYMQDYIGSNNFTAGYGDLFGSHDGMACGLYFTNDFLAENQDLYIKFDLNIYRIEDSVVKETITLASVKFGKEPVAAVNGVPYADIQAAVLSARDGDTIDLLTNVSASEIIVIDDAITFNGNGNTITSSASRAINVKCTGEVTIKNLTIETASPCERAINIIEAAGTTNIENITVVPHDVTDKGLRIAVNAANNLPAGAVVNIKDSTLSAWKAIQEYASGSTLNVENSTLIGWAAISILGSNTNINVTNSTLVGNNTYPADQTQNTYSTIALAANTQNVKINVTGGSVTAQSNDGCATQWIYGYNENCSIDAKLDTEFNLEGNNTDYLNVDFAASSLSVRKEYDNGVRAQGFVTDNNDDGTVKVLKGVVAKVGDEYYETLEEALDASGTGDTIKVLTAKDGEINEIIKTSNKELELGETKIITTDVDEGIVVSVPELINVAIDNYDSKQVTYEVVVDNNGTAYDEADATLNLDISLKCTYDGITEDIETNGKVFTVKVKLPANADLSVIPTVKHDGTPIADVKVVDGYVVFETDDFSPYSIDYKLLGVSAAPAAMCETAKVKFVVSEENENDTIYDIVIESTDSNEIFGLVSAQLDITEAADMSGVNFVVAGANDFIITDHTDDSYLFTLKSADNQALADTKSGTSVKIGTLTVSGFTTDIATGNVETYTVNAVIGTDDGAATSYFDTNVIPGETKNIHITLEGSSVEYTKDVPKNELTVEVTFPKNISDNNMAYQDMKITVTEQDLGIVAEFDLGINGDATIVDNKYTVSAELQRYKTYTVTIEGAGYRTYSKAVELNADKTLIVWNNYKDNGALIVKDGETTPEAVATITFLAGDIVKDNTVNAYDLSVLLSYAFTDGINTAAASKYAQYDLNRDGLINYKDAAMILDTYVWGK